LSDDLPVKMPAQRMTMQVSWMRVRAESIDVHGDARLVGPLESHVA